jgi:hypothetical protein
MLLLLALIIVILWAMGGFALHLGGDLIHLLLLVAVVLVIIEYLPRLRGGGDV